MPYGLLAELVVILHFLFVAYAILGGLLAFRWRWSLFVHLPAFVWAALIEFMHWTCPLTPLENWLRRASGQPAYEGGFIERYLVDVLYPPGLTHTHQLVLGTALVGFNLALYAFWWRRQARSHDSD